MNNLRNAAVNFARYAATKIPHLSQVPEYLDLAAAIDAAGSAPLLALRNHVTGAIERGEAVAIVEQPPKPWHVVAVSSNHGAFGHKGVQVINEDGEGLELVLQAYGVEPLPKRGDVLNKLPASEVPPRKLPKVSPEFAKKIIEQL